MSGVIKDFLKTSMFFDNDKGLESEDSNEETEKTASKVTILFKTPQEFKKISSILNKTFPNSTFEIKD